MKVVGPVLRPVSSMRCHLTTLLTCLLTLWKERKFIGVDYLLYLYENLSLYVPCLIHVSRHSRVFSLLFPETPTSSKIRLEITYLYLS